MTTRAALQVGDRIAFDDDEHHVVAVAGTSVRLRAESGGEQVVLAGHLMAAPEFAILDAASGRAALPPVEPFGLLETLPPEVVADAERWRDHLVEVETGRPPGAPASTPPRPCRRILKSDPLASSES